MAHDLAVDCQRVMFARNGAVNHLKADQQTLWLFEFCLKQSLMTNKILLPRNRPAQPGFKWVRVGINLVTIEWHTRFKAQTVTRGEATREQTEFLTGSKQSIPQL